MNLYWYILTIEIITILQSCHISLQIIIIILITVFEKRGAIAPRAHKQNIHRDECYSQKLRECIYSYMFVSCKVLNKGLSRMLCLRQIRQACMPLNVKQATKDALRYICERFNVTIITFNGKVVF